MAMKIQMMIFWVVRMEVAWSSKMLVSCHITTWCYNVGWRQHGLLKCWYPTT